jgi:hypothetical protein
MDFRSRLVHADAKSRVVLVRAFEGARCLGSALGEAISAEEAEDRASHRLRQRLQQAAVTGPPPQETLAGVAAAPGGTDSLKETSPERENRHGASAGMSPELEDPLPSQQASLNEPQQVLPSSRSKDLRYRPELRDRLGSEALQPPTVRSSAPLPSESSELEEPDADPEDWSADLGRLDSLLASLGWGREQERIYLQRLFGQPSRCRLTRYADLMVLRRALEALPPGSAPYTAALPTLRRELLAQCDALVAQLGWTTEQARQCLEGQFAVSSRQRLSDDQLLAFNLLLEGELLDLSVNA